MSYDVVQKVALWFATGSVGISSKAMATWIGLGELPSDRGHPYDPDDLDRCLRLLEAVPELREKLPAMRGLSPQWEALVNRWDEVERSHLEEVGLGWTKARSAPRTYKLMREILDSVPEPGVIRFGGGASVRLKP